MRYYELTAGDKTYKLRIVTRDHQALEKLLGGRVMEALQDVDKLSDINTFVSFLQIASKPMQSENGVIITREKAFDIIDELIDDGKCMEDFIQIIMSIAEASGFLREGTYAEALAAQQQIQTAE